MECSSVDCVPDYVFLISAFLITPTMAVTIAPVTPPPTSWPAAAPMSKTAASGRAQSWNEACQDLAADTAPQRAGDRISKRAEAEIFQEAACGIPSNGAANQLND